MTNKVEKLITYPCLFTFKAMMNNSQNASVEIVSVVEQFAPVNRQNVSTRVSRSAKYISVSCTAHLDNPKQLENIYQKLREHPEVVMTL